MRSTIMTLDMTIQNADHLEMSPAAQEIRGCVAEIHSVPTTRVSVHEAEGYHRQCFLVDLPNYVPADELPVLRADIEVSLPSFEVLDLTETLVFLGARR